MPYFDVLFKFFCVPWTAVHYLLYQLFFLRLFMLFLMYFVILHDLNECQSQLDGFLITIPYQHFSYERIDPLRIIDWNIGSVIMSEK